MSDAYKHLDEVNVHWGQEHVVMTLIPQVKMHDIFASLLLSW